MDFSNFHFDSLAVYAIIGTAFGAVLRGWASVKSFLWSVVGIFIVRASLEDEETSQVVLAYLVKTYPRSTMGVMSFGGKHESLRDGRFGHIPYENFAGRTTVFWRRIIPFWFSVSIEKGNDKQIYWGRPQKEIKCSIVYLRFTLNVEAVVKAASSERNDIYWENKQVVKAKRFFIKRIPDPMQEGFQRYSAGTSLAWYQEGVYRLLSHKPDELGRSSQTKGRATDNLYFPPSVKKLIDEIEMWRKLKDWYVERGIPWKRGWVLYGPPGTGKTAITRAVAEDMDMPLFVYSLGTMLNGDLEKSWADMQTHVPCIALFEDFDNVFHGRENVYGKPTLSDVVVANAVKDEGPVNTGVNRGQLSFDCLLNCLDGVEKSNGIFTVITTNNIDKLDVAMGQPRKNPDGTIEFISTRPGRVDNAIELGYMRNEEKMQLAQRIFFDDKAGLEHMRRLVEADPKKQETPAQFQERCAKVALQMLWDKQHNPVVNGQHKNGNSNGHKKNGKLQGVRK